MENLLYCSTAMGHSITSNERSNKTERSVAQLSLHFQTCMRGTIAQTRKYIFGAFELGGVIIRKRFFTERRLWIGFFIFLWGKITETHFFPYELSLLSVAQAPEIVDLHISHL